MAFLYKAFIRKNTPELRAKLEDLGYTNGAWESPRFHYPYLSVWPNPKFGLFKGEGFYMTEDDYRLDGKVWEYKPKEDVIDCGDNEELFLAIAALRDDTDYMQWFMIPHTKTVPVPGYCGQQGMAGYQRIITSVEYHKYDRKDNRISDLIKFEKEDGETILPRKLNIDELKLWFNHKIMNNPYKDDPNIKCYTNNIRDNITEKKKRDCQGNKKVFSKRK